MNLEGIALLLSVFLNVSAVGGMVFKLKDKIIHPIEMKLDKVQDSVNHALDKQERLEERINYLESHIASRDRRYIPFSRRL